MKILLRCFRCFVTSCFIILLWVSCSLAQVNQNAASQNFIDRNDKNKDGKLSRDELPSGVQRNFERVDRNGDGFITLEEDLAFRNMPRQRGKGIKIPPGIIVHKDIAYIENGHERHKLDLYLPKDTNPDEALPLVVWIHGGGWKGGDKSRLPALFLLKHGYAVASVNYRLSSHAVFPAQIQDCQRAIIFLRNHAKKYSLDPTRFGAWGSSAGGHLVSLLGTAENDDFLDEGEGDCSVQAVCDYFGPIDLLKMNEQAGSSSAIDHDAPDSPESKLLGGTLQENKAKAQAANPANYLSDDDPPFLVIHGDKDRLVSVQQSKDFHVALEAAGIESELQIVNGAGHGGFRKNNEVLAFFNQNLNSPSAGRKSYLASLVFAAPFDDAETEVNHNGKRCQIHTASSLKRESVRSGNTIASTTLVESGGVSGGCLRFKAKTKEVAFYPLTDFNVRPRENWSGTVSFFLKLDPDQDLEPGYCDPILFTQRKWNDAAMWVDFDKQLPRAFRLGAYSDFKYWNPENKKYDTFAVEKLPLATVAKPPFSSKRWTHVAFTFVDINSTQKNPATVRLYLDGELSGTITKPMKFSFDESGSAKSFALLLGVNYIGDMDEVMVFDRELTSFEIKAINSLARQGNGQHR